MAILTREIVGGDGLRDERGVVLADPVAPYRRGFEDATYDRCWFCPYRTGSRDAREYAAGHEAAREMRRRQVRP